MKSPGLPSLWSLLLASIPVTASPAQSPNKNNAQIITGLFGSPTSEAQIVIHDTNGRPSWTWNVSSGKNVSPQLRQCLHDACRGGGCAVPEVKWAENGQSVLAIYGYGAIIINHHPGRADDKQITFGVCLNRDGMENSHTVELLPDGKVAIATTTSELTGNIKIFNRWGSQPFSQPTQTLDGIPAVHALLWEPDNNLLWAAGNDRSPLAQGSTSILNSYTYQNGWFQTTPQTRVITPAVHLTSEWGGNTPWWDGSHAMTPVPNQRKLLISTDLDIHLYDMDEDTFVHGSAVQEAHLRGFQALGARVGIDGANLPRSDIKSVSFLENGHGLYVQAVWNETYGKSVTVLTGGSRRSIWNQMLYRARWFAETVW